MFLYSACLALYFSLFLLVGCLRDVLCNLQSTFLSACRLSFHHGLFLSITFDFVLGILSFMALFSSLYKSSSSFSQVFWVTVGGMRRGLYCRARLKPVQSALCHFQVGSIFCLSCSTWNVDVL